MADIKKIDNIEDYNKFVNSSNDNLSVVKVSASWCGPCRVLGETIKNLSQEDVEGVLLADVEADAEWFEDEADKLNIRGIPVLVAFKDGKETDRIQGAQTREALIEFFGRNK